MNKHIALILASCAFASAGAQTLSLPFADSFAGGETLDETKWERQAVAGAQENLWLMGHKINSFKSGDPDFYPVDDDNGLIYCLFANTREGNDGRLATLPIATDGAPVLDFYLWRANQIFSDSSDAIKVQIQIDDEDWQDVPGGLYLNKPEEGADDAFMGWYNYKLPLGDLIPDDASTFRVGFLSMARWGYNMGIDNVNIYTLGGNDIEVVSLSAQDKVLAGNNIDLLLILENKGSALAADDYSIRIDSDFPYPVEIESVDIPSAGTVKLTASLPLTAEEAYGKPDYRFKATVIYAEDQNTDNNESEELTVATGFSSNVAPSELKAVTEENSGIITFNWKEAKDGTYVPVNMTENFETLEEGTKGNFNGWTSLDFDGQKIDYGYYTVFSGEFEVIVAENPTSARGDNHFIGVIAAGKGQQNDWLISPRIDCKEDASLTLEARAAVKSSETSNAHMQVLYCEEEQYDPESPASSFKVFMETTSGLTDESILYQDEAFHKMWIRNIPSSAKYVALRFDTKPTVDIAIWLDDLKIYENDNAPLLGYHVYERNFGRLNENALGATTLEYEHADKARDEVKEREFYVTAIYPDGESEPSELAVLGVMTGVENVGNAEGTAEYYNLQGIKVSNPERGIFVKVQGGKAVVVKM